jgi:hypothetical protein
MSGARPAVEGEEGSPSVGAKVPFRHGGRTSSSTGARKAGRSLIRADRKEGMLVGKRRERRSGAAVSCSRWLVQSLAVLPAGQLALPSRHLALSSSPPGTSQLPASSMARATYAPLATDPAASNDDRQPEGSPAPPPSASAAAAAAALETRPSPRAASGSSSPGHPRSARRRTFLLVALATFLVAVALLRSSSLRPFASDRPPAAALPTSREMSTPAPSQTAAGKRSVG